MKKTKKFQLVEQVLVVTEELPKYNMDVRPWLGIVSHHEKNKDNSASGASAGATIKKELPKYYIDARPGFSSVPIFRVGTRSRGTEPTAPWLPIPVFGLCQVLPILFGGGVTKRGHTCIRTTNTSLTLVNRYRKYWHR